MSTITLFVNYEREKLDNVLSALKQYRGVLIEISDILNIIVYQTSSAYIKDIKKTDGVTFVTNKAGENVG